MDHERKFQAAISHAMKTNISTFLCKKCDAASLNMQNMEI